MTNTVHMYSWVELQEVEAYRDDARSIVRQSGDADLFEPKAQLVQVDPEEHHLAYAMSEAENSFRRDWAVEANAGDEDAQEHMEKLERAEWRTPDGRGHSQHDNKRRQVWVLTHEGESLGYLFLLEHTIG